MSRSSPGSAADGQRRDRAQTEPIAALVAVLAIAIGLALYAGVAVDRQPARDETDAEATMQRVEAGVLEDGVLEWNRSLQFDRFARPGEAVNVTIAVNGSRRRFGPRAPPGADRASRPVTIAFPDGVQRPGQLTVGVWES